VADKDITIHQRVVIADGARPIARVGDVIEHGQPIPANVVRMRDAQNSEGHTWVRVPDSTTRWDYVFGRNPGKRQGALAERDLMSSWWPMTVVEVDPEPQPAEPERMSRCQVAQRCLKGMCEPTDECPSDPVSSGPGNREPDPREVADTHLMMTLGVDRLDGVIPAIESLLADRKTLMLVESELGVTRPEDVVTSLEKRFNALVLARRARDEAVSRMQESERSTAALMVQLGQMYEDLGVETGVEALAAIERLKREPAESGPVVLSLPQVPPGAVALVDVISGARWRRDEDDRWEKEDREGFTLTLGEILQSGPVTVEFAPPREPRTWPKLDPPDPETITLRGASGTIYKRRGGSESAWYGHRDGRTICRSLGALCGEDGPLTEVVDDGQ
jgi:hypothetical protein